MNAHSETIGDQGVAMDRMYRLQRHFYDITRRYYLLGRDQMLAGLNPPTASSILEIGCGTGRNLIATARRYPDAKLYGVDISQEMLKTALNNFSASGAANPVTMACADATNFDPVRTLGAQKFDRIFFSYTLSMVPEWQNALAHAWELLAVNGELHIVDFGPSNQLPKLFQSALFKWLNLFHVTPRLNLPAVLAELTPKHNQTCAVQPLFRSYAMIAIVKQTKTNGC